MAIQCKSDRSLVYRNDLIQICIFVGSLEQRIEKLSRTHKARLLGALIGQAESMFVFHETY